MITVEKLTKKYGATSVVDEVSMVIERNSITVIVGSSGSGKSTLLRMINRLVEPSSGRVLIDGKDTASEPAHLLRRRIGYAIQGHGLFPHRTVAENIATVPRLLKWEESRVRAVACRLEQRVLLLAGLRLAEREQHGERRAGALAYVGRVELLAGAHALVHFLGENPVRTASIGLGAIERKIGLLQKGGQVRPVVGRAHDADAGADQDLMTLDLEGVVEQRDQELRLVLVVARDDTDAR